MVGKLREGGLSAVELRATIESFLENCREPALAGTGRRNASTDGRERRGSPRGRGIEFAERDGGQLVFGLSERRPAREHQANEIARLAEEMARVRSAESADRLRP